MSTTSSIHDALVFPRRIDRLHSLLLPLLSGAGSVLDVGCGDGSLDRRLMHDLASTVFEGVDVLVRKESQIHVRQIDGKTIPYPDKTFDVVMFIDVLHHCDTPLDLLTEANRIAKNKVILKDHRREGIFSEFTLRIMDEVGNARHGVPLPYNYLCDAEWQDLLSKARLEARLWKTHLNIYPFPASLVFDRGLHFIAELAPS